MASSQSPAGNVDLFDLYFQRADLDRDGRISGAEAVTFFQGSGLPKPVLAQVWAFANVRQADFLGRAEFYNALKLVTVAQSNRQLTPDIVKAALYSPAAAKIPAPKINVTNTQPLPGSSASAAPKPPLPTPTTASQPMQGTATQGFPRGGVAAGPRPPTPNISNEWAAGSTVGAPTGTSLQVQNKGTTSSMGLGGFGLTTLGSTTSLPSTSQPTSGTKSLGTVIKDTNNANVSGNGFASESFFGGDVFSATPVQPKQDASANTFSARSLPASPALVPNSSGTQPSVRPSTFDSVQRSATTPIPVRQFQPAQSVVRPDKVSAPSPPSIPGVAPASGQSQVPWPKMTQIDAQKYMKVFVEVDTDKDGKITGEQARNLFLSWRLPREVLKQVWDLSDQDNDSMLSFKEFCIALYLMERYREGRTIPAALPSNVIVEVSSCVQPAPNAGNAAWRQSGVQQHAGGFQQQQNVSATGPRPPLPRPFAVPQADDESKVSQPKSRVPELEKHLIDQLSTEEQNSLNLKFKEATEAEKKVEELEKEILESRQKIEFFGSKMQELVLYKSRCDNRLNEIMERSSVDKKEAESLAKKYEEKYKQTGDVASKLTIEEATFRDMQEKKMELYRAIVKLEQGSDSDIQERADKIQSDLDELVRALNERCKKYGLRGKPITLTELPFGWQPGIQAGAADWDEDWDKFEDEGFFFVKELTLDVQNVIAPPKEKFVLPQKKEPSSVESPKAISSSNGDVKLDKPDNVDERIVENGSHSKSEDLAKNAPTSPMGPNSPMGPTSPLGPNSPMGPTSPMGSNSPIGTSSYIGSPSGEFSYSNFDKTFGSDASPRVKETQSDHGGAGSLFSSDKGFDEPAWGTYDMNDDIDSVWGFNASSSTIKDTDHERNDYFFGSEDFGLNPIRTGTTQSSSFSQSNRTFNFDDSVPSTPLYNTGNSPPGYKDSSEPSFDSFSRFDSFRTYDSGFLPKDTFSRFDSMRGSRDFDQSHGFPPLDDSDPFGSSGPFRKSLDSQTPRKSSDSWNAF